MGIWDKRQVLVTGAGGFVGSHLAEQLALRGAEVRAVARYNSRNFQGFLETLDPEVGERIEVRMGDVTDPTFVREAVRGCDAVFHLAALIGIPYSYVAPRAYVDVNVGGTVNVLQAAREEECTRVVHTSTSEVYGSARYTPMDVAHPLQGQSPYSASKIAADKLAESYYLSFGLPVTTVRPFNIYGPRQSARAIVPTIFTQALWSERIKLGSLSPIRDLTFVLDTVWGFIAAAEAEACVGEVVHVGNGFGVSIGELVEKIIAITGVEKEIVLDEQRVRPEKSEVQELVCDNSATRETLGWQPEYDLERGLRATLEFIEQHHVLYKPDEYNV